MKNNISKYMMIAAAAVALLAAAPAQAQKGGGGTTGPTPVVEQNAPAKSAMMISFQCSTNTPNCTTSAAIPLGMRFVVESINGYMISTLDVPHYFAFTPVLDGVSQSFQSFYPTSTMASNGAFLTAFNITTLMYLDSISNFTRMGPISFPATINLNGYLVKK